MKPYTSWFILAGVFTATFHYFERRRATTLAQLSAVTRDLREAIEARAAV